MIVVKIKNFFLIMCNTSIFNSQLAPNMDGHPATKGDIHIENDVWIGESVILMSGIRIGNGAIVGAKSVVTKDVEPYSVVAGNPARQVKKRFSEELITELQKLKWWEFDDEEIKLLIPYLQQEPCSKIIKSISQQFKR